MANLIFNITLYHYLILALLLFAIGLAGVILSKNILKVLISAEFLLSAVNINFVAFAFFADNVNLTGFIFSIFTVAVGAVELAVAVAIFYLMYKNKKSVDINEYKELKG
ncbi:NADH-quinone oxidoreductase subunit NuoK [bacterium]|nr:NADH-quinone oxidoreductase subunit NuoK [bacterium]